jgi:dienelactone hydrolase
MSRKPLSTKAKMQFLVVAIFAGVFLTGIVLFQVYPANVKRTYGQFTTTQDGVSICYDVFEPANSPSGVKRNAVILGHGVMVGKEMMRLIALELAKAGFVAIPFDFRGHGLSSGELTGFSLRTFGQFSGECDRSNTLTLDILAIKEVLRTKVKDINMTNLGYVGYSMGGGAGFSLLSYDNDFNAMVGLAPMPSYGCVNTTNPRNLLVIIGQYDEAFNEDLLTKVIKNKTGLASINRNQLYGDFSDGSAAELYVDDNTDHFTGPYDYDFALQIRNWVLQALAPTTPFPTDLAYPVLGIAVLMQLIGGIGFFLSSSIPLLDKFARKRERYPVPEPVVAATATRAFYGKFMALELPLSLACVVIALPLALTPIPFSGIFLAFFVGPSIAIIVLLWRTYKKAGASFKQAYRAVYATTTKQNVGIGIGMGGLLYVILYLSMGSVIPTIPGMTRWGWLPLFLAVQFLSVVNILIFGLQFIYEKIGRGHRWGITATIAANFLLLVTIFSVPVLVVCTLIGNFFFLVGFIPAFFLFLVASAVSTVYYARTNDIILPAIATAIPIALFLATLSPYITSFL